MLKKTTKMVLGYKIENINSNTVIFHLEGKMLSHVETINLIHDVEVVINKGGLNLICSLQRLEYLNSTGLGLLIKVLTKMRNSGGELVLCDITPVINKLFVTSKLNSIFTMRNTIEESLDFFKIKLN